MGYERFLGPEVFFNPEIFSSDFTTPLPDVVDESIMKCPIDVRRKLYNNVVLSGGTTMFKDFGRRLERDIKRNVDNRMRENMAKLSSLVASAGAPPEIDVNVVTHPMQRYAVWFGGSYMASMVSSVALFLHCFVLTRLTIFLLLCSRNSIVCAIRRHNTRRKDLVSLVTARCSAPVCRRAGVDYSVGSAVTEHCLFLITLFSVTVLVSTSLSFLSHHVLALVASLITCSDHQDPGLFLYRAEP